MVSQVLTRLMAERINYGGIAATREQVYDHALSVCRANLEGQPDADKRARLGADMFAFGPRTRPLSDDEAAGLISWEEATAAGLLD
jgi:hypothetical protein